jgi:hypothetical protein
VLEADVRPLLLAVDDPDVDPEVVILAE